MAMPPPYYSQFGEDEILARGFGDQPGWCIEVGGFDGVTGSTTYHFEQRGWPCLVVEPIPELVARIRAARRCPVAACAASDRAGEVEFSVAEGVEMFSAIMPDQARVESYHGRLRTIRVRTATLDQILADAGVEGPIRFVTIDVEGHELDVLRGFSLERYAPEVLIVENNRGPADAEVRRWLEARGYRRFKITGCNEWYAPRTNRRFYSPWSASWTDFAEAWRHRFSRQALHPYIPGFLLRWRRRLRGNCPR